MRRAITLTIVTLTLLTGMVWIVRPKSHALDSSPRKSGKSDRLVVHEWGTFTSYSGSDGVRLEFRPLFDNDLPEFVLDRSSQSGKGLFSKLNYRALVRMETPVTYFYTDRIREVRVKVGFPEGLLTEFYPPVHSFSPPYVPGKPEPTHDSTLDWGQVTLVPPSALEFSTGHSALDTAIRERLVEGLLPHSRAPNHYDFARETDSTLVHVKRGVNDESSIQPTGDYFEKFLFYRGLGNFSLPLAVEAQTDGQLEITNLQDLKIGALFVVHCDDTGIRFASLGTLPPRGALRAAVPTTIGDQTALQEAVVEALVAEGLYEKEAKAMVKTWQNSWFTERGLRLFYTVPQPIVDQMLPLQVEPQPEEVVRVMVGRMEVMTREEEARMTQVVLASAKARSEAWERASQTQTTVNYELPAEIRELGRLAEPALIRLKHARIDDPVIEAEASTLLRELAQFSR